MKNVSGYLKILGNDITNIKLNYKLSQETKKYMMISTILKNK